MFPYPHHLVVLSSGAASRLRPWSDAHTKTLLLTCGGCLLERLVDGLGLGATSITVVSQVPRDSSAEIVRREVEQASPTVGVHLVGTEGGDPWSDVYRRVRSLGESASVILVNGDLVLSPEWAHAALTAVASGRTTLFAQEGDGRGHQFNVVRTGPGPWRYSPAPTLAEVEAIGMSVLAPGALADIDPAQAVGVNPWFDVVLPALATAGVVDVVVGAMAWADLGSWPGLLAWEAQHHAEEDGRSCREGQVDPAAALVGSVVMAGGRVGEDCRLEGVVVLPDGVVPAGAFLSGMVVGADGATPIRAR